MRPRFALLLVGIAIFSVARSSQGLGVEEYLRRVKPILERRCFACHGPLKQEASLRPHTGNTIRAGGGSGPAITAGDAAKSILIERITAADEAERMPPEGAALTGNEIQTITEWINAGAPSPKDEIPQQDPKH